MNLTRRDLGKLAMGALPLAARAAAKPNSLFGGVQVGINAPYSFHNLPGGATDILGYLIEVGLSAVELRSQPVEGWLKAPAVPRHARGAKLTPEQTEELKTANAALEKWRLARSSGEIKAFRKLYEDAGVLIQILKIDGIDQMADPVVDYFFEMARTLGAYAISCEIPVSRTKRLGEFASKHKLKVGYHGHGNITNPEAFGSLSSWERAMSFSPYNCANVDIGHFYAANGFSPGEWIKAHHDRVTHVHLKDRKKNNGPGMPWGQGDTPLKEILLMMKREKYKFQATIEMEYPIPAGSSMLAETAKCVQFCKEVLS
jgi:sugar phosphate isomerase/epimerase